MRIVAIFLGLIVVPGLAFGFEAENREWFGPNPSERVLRILSTADTDVFAPIIREYRAGRPDLAIDYVVASSGEVMKALAEEDRPFDIAISSAMDMQTKLANDGFAAPYRSAVTQSIPEWARWRDHVFAFTREPAALILSKSDFGDTGLPATRQDLMRVMRQHPDRFRGRIGTYDVRTSGLGYLFATQDARTSETYWRLTEIMGFLDAQLYCCSSEMIDDVANGKLAFAYNVLGSYASAREDQDKFAIVYPRDFATVILRTLLIPRGAPSPQDAGDFVDFVLSNAWAADANKSRAFERLSIKRGDADTNFRRIRLGAGLLVHLDRLKKASFLKAWENAVYQN